MDELQHDARLIAQDDELLPVVLPVADTAAKTAGDGAAARRIQALLECREIPQFQVALPVLRVDPALGKIAGKLPDAVAAVGEKIRQPHVQRRDAVAVHIDQGDAVKKRIDLPKAIVETRGTDGLGRAGEIVELEQHTVSVTASGDAFGFQLIVFLMGDKEHAPVALGSGVFQQTQDPRRNRGQGKALGGLPGAQRLGQKIDPTRDLLKGTVAEKHGKAVAPELRQGKGNTVELPAGDKPLFLRPAQEGDGAEKVDAADIVIVFAVARQFHRDALFPERVQRILIGHGLAEVEALHLFTAMLRR